jgi:hypothetical protein
LLSNTRAFAGSILRLYSIRNLGVVYGASDTYISERVISQITTKERSVGRFHLSDRTITEDFTLVEINLQPRKLLKGFYKRSLRFLA